MHNWNDLTCIVFKNIGQNKKISLLAPEHIINFTTLENRITSLVIHLRDSSREILLLSVYLHSGNYKNQLALLRKLSDQLLHFNNENPDIHFLIGGDFNNVLDQDLDVIRPDILIRPRLTAQEKDIMDYFEAFIAEHNLADVKTHLYPNTTEPTNNMNTKRRLDRFYLSNDLIWSLLDYRIPEDHTIGSTHFAIVMKMKICISPKLKIGDPRFCIPNKLLADDNVLQCLNQYRPRFLDNIFLSWEDNLDYLTAEIQQLKQLIHRLQRIRQAETQHVIPKTDEDQERLLKYRFRGPREVNIIENMERTDGTPVINTPEMLNVATSFYKELYQQYHVPLDPLSEFINTFPHKLTSSEKTSLEKPFTEDELYDHLVIISKSTSTGTDGISYYSLIRLWPRLGRSLTKVGNMIMETGELPPSMQTNLITLIPKRNKKVPSIDNFRPISLINCSLRLLSSFFEARFQTVLANYIAGEQTGFMKNRTINETITLLRRIIKTNSDFDDFACFVNIDFRKAFDSVSHDFIELLLEKMDFGRRARNFLLAITTKQQGQIIINNLVGSRFPLERGTRQGNPLSPLIFNLVLETLFIQITNKMQGACLNASAHLQLNYTAYADDVLVYCNNETDQRTFKDLLAKFSIESGLHVNHTKTNVVYYNDPPANQIFPYPIQKLDPNTFKHLGIPLRQRSESYNPWKKTLNELRYLIQCFPTFDLNGHAIIQLINSHVFSKLYFRDLHSPLESSDLVPIYESIRKKFIPRVKLKKLQTPKTSGGFGLLNILDQVLGRRAKEVFKLFMVDDSKAVDDFRFRLQEICQDAASEYYNQQPNSRHQIFYPWHAFLRRQPPTVTRPINAPYNWKNWQRQIVNQFEEPERSWLNAWFVVTSSATNPPPVGYRAMDLEQIETCFTSAQPQYISQLLDLKNEPLSALSFHQTSKKRQGKDPIIPNLWLRNCARRPDEWSTFWINFNDQNKHPLGCLSVYHTLALGNYQWPLYTGLVWLRGACSFCARPGGDNLLHHIFYCPESLEIWSQKSNQSLTAEYILGNPRLSPREFKCINGYLKVIIQKVERRRR